MNGDLAPLRQALRLPFWHKSDVEAEIAAHLEEARLELTAKGQDPEAARRTALARLGDLEALGKSLQAVHRGWIGGRTVRKKLLEAACAAVIMLAAVALWGYVGLVNVRQQDREDSRAATLANLARDREDLLRGLQDWRQHESRLVWAGLVDGTGSLAWQDPWVAKATSALPTTYELHGMDRRRPLRGAQPPSGGTDPALQPLARALRRADLRVDRLSGFPAANFEREWNFGTILLATRHATALETVAFIAGNTLLWWGLLWLLAAGVIFAHRRRLDRYSAWVWGVAALVAGPLAWLGYLVVTIAARPRPAPFRPVAGLVTICLLVLVAGMCFSAPRRQVLGAVGLARYLPYYPERDPEPVAAARAAGSPVLTAAATPMELQDVRDLFETLGVRAFRYTLDIPRGRFAHLQVRGDTLHGDVAVLPPGRHSILVTLRSEEDNRILMNVRYPSVEGGKFGVGTSFQVHSTRGCKFESTDNLSAPGWQESQLLSVSYFENDSQDDPTMVTCAITARLVTLAEARKHRGSEFTTTPLPDPGQPSEKCRR